MDANFSLQVLHEAEIGLVLAVGGWILMFPVRTLIAKAKELLDTFDKRLSSMQSELVQQRTNCLTTLQNQGDKQIEVLEKMSGTLEQMHLSQAEMAGYFKGSRKGI